MATAFIAVCRRLFWAQRGGGGQPTRIITNYPAGPQPDRFQVLCMQYNIDQQLWLMRDVELTVSNGQIVDRQVLRVREFRYGPTDRARYMVRERDPVTLAPLETTWHEYLGDQIYQDLLIDDSDPNHPVVTPTARYDFAYGLIGIDDAAGRRFVHSDMLGTTRLLTGDPGSPTPGDPTGTVRAALAFTAFGEPLGSYAGDGAALPRYGYAGTWGYQSDSLADPGVFYAPLLHVGARWYDPRLGRFLQRDPIGIAGGLNVYAYVNGAPTIAIDPDGRYGTVDTASAITNIVVISLRAILSRPAVVRLLIRPGIEIGPTAGGFSRAWFMYGVEFTNRARVVCVSPPPPPSPPPLPPFGF